MEFAVGDEVAVLYKTHRKTEHMKGTVIKVARRYVPVAYMFRGRKRNDAFDMDTGQERGSETMYGAYVKTLEQAALDERHAAALTILKAAKVTLDYGHRLTLEQIEAIAKVVSGD